MKKILAAVVALMAVVVVAHAALAFMGPRHWVTMRHPMMMQLGSHVMGQGAGPMGPGMHRGAMPATHVSEDEAKAIAQKYVDEQLKGYTIENVTPSTGMPRTMYAVELKGPKGEVKTLHISPFGHVMPFPLQQRQG